MRVLLSDAKWVSESRQQGRTSSGKVGALASITYLAIDPKRRRPCATNAPTSSVTRGRRGPPTAGSPYGAACERQLPVRTSHSSATAPGRSPGAAHGPRQVQYSSASMAAGATQRQIGSHRHCSDNMRCSTHSTTRARAYQHIRFVEPDQVHETAVHTVLCHLDVAFVHVSSAVAQCITFEVRPTA